MGFDIQPAPSPSPPPEPWNSSNTFYGLPPGLGQTTHMTTTELIMRRKGECGTRIQRFWTHIREAFRCLTR